MTAPKEDVKNRVSDIVVAYGCEIVEFKLFLVNGIKTLRCLIDYPQGGVNLDTCSKVNKEISAYIEEEGLLGDNYAVEVNSPGMDRPLKTKNDFYKARGKIVSLWFWEPVFGKPSIEGEVLDVKDDKLVLIYKNQEEEIGLSKIKLGKEKIKFTKGGLNK